MFVLTISSILLIINAFSSQNVVDTTSRCPDIIAHRGSSGTRPEHTVAAYMEGVKYGANYIECDAVLTKDLHFICHHDFELNTTTNIQKIYPNRSDLRCISENNCITDFFSTDFTLAELIKVKVNQRYQSRNPEYNEIFRLVSLSEYIDLMLPYQQDVGMYIEIKISEFQNELELLRNENTTIEKVFNDMMKSKELINRSDNCLIQSFSEQTLQALSQISDLRLIQLVWCDDEYQITTTDLHRWSIYAYGIGVSKSCLIEINEKGKISGRNKVVEIAHELDMVVHVYTFKNDDTELPHEYEHDPYLEMKDFYSLDIDGYFTDFPQTASNFLKTLFCNQ